MPQSALILAGGFGTRLQTVVNDVPKPMAPVNGQPFLNYLLRYLKHYGIRKVCLSVGYLHEKISEYYKDEFEGIHITYSIEEIALGTGGGIRKALAGMNEKEIFALNGDSFFDVNLREFYKAHQTYGATISLALREVQNAARFGTIVSNKQYRILSFKEKSGEERPGMINGGVYILDRDVYLDSTKADSVFSIEKDFFETELSRIPMMGFPFTGHFIDIGIPEEFAKAQHEFKQFTY